MKCQQTDDGEMFDFWHMCNVGGAICLALMRSAILDFTHHTSNSNRLIE